jgi:hypothetical protein
MKVLRKFQKETLAYLGILLAGLALFYSLVLAPEINNWRLDRCLEEKQNSYYQLWDAECAKLQLKPRCDLAAVSDNITYVNLGRLQKYDGDPAEKASQLNKALEKAKALCVEKYKR